MLMTANLVAHFLGGLDRKESAGRAGNPRSIPES